MSAIFRQLTSGIKFDKKKYKQDAEKFGLISKQVSSKETNKDDDDQNISLDDDFVPDSNLPTPNESDEENNDAVKLLGSMTKKKPLKKSGKIKTKSDLLRIHREKINRFRNIHRIHIKGTDIPDPIDSWEKLKDNYGVPNDLLQVLETSYEKPTAVQMQAIPLMLERRETLVCAPTGSGKTISYLLPLVHHLREPRNKVGFRGVIVAPTRELASQIHRECLKLCQKRGLRPFIMDKMSKSGKKIQGLKLDILVTTPNRLVYMIKNEEITLRNVEWLIIDESDKLFETTGGEATSFREQLACIYKACSEGESQLRRAFFSATLATDVEEWCSLNLDNVGCVTIGIRHTATESIQQTLTYTGTEKGKLLAFRQLIERGQLKPPVLVFVQEKERAKELFSELIKEKIHVDAIHSERSQLQRDNTVRAFRSGQIWVLICTELMGRGIDFKGVNLVINYDFPPSTVSYIHRIGRTGRGGRKGEAITFFTDKDKTLLRDVATIVQRSGGQVPEYMLKMKKASRQDKRKMAKNAVFREGITKESRDKQRKRKRKMNQNGAAQPPKKLVKRQ